MKIDVVFSGGGVKAFAFLGALQTLKEKDFTIERVGGTSAGAIIAALIQANYSVEEIKEIFFTTDLHEFLDPPFYAQKYSPFKWLSLYIHKGLYKGDRFERWLANKLRKKGIVTFYDLNPGMLKVVASDITKGRLVVLPDDLERLYRIKREQFHVATAVRMSAGFPYFFMPKQLKNDEGKWSHLVDGGLLSNFPLWLFKNEQQLKRPVLGITLSEAIDQQAPRQVRHGLDMLQAIFHTMLKAHDTRYITTNKSKHVIFIPVKQIPAVDLRITRETKEQLIELGAKYTLAFLKKWAY